jgi:hypothetical protein
LQIVSGAGCGRSNGARSDGAASLLVTGGFNRSGVLASAEILVPSLGAFVATRPMHTARLSHSATLLQNGEVLVAGGTDSLAFPAAVFASAELYDPSTKGFSMTGSLVTARSGHTATLLPNGQVLIAGGSDGSQSLASAELYDPTIGTFSLTGSMNVDREDHTATLLVNGQVLIAGGFSSTGSAVQSTAELYDPASGTFTLTGAMTAARENHTATPLPGKVLVAGGVDNDGNVLATTEVYDPVAGQFSFAASMTISRYGHFAAPLHNGDVLIGGGIDNAGSSLASAERYLTGAETFEKVGSMPRDRFFVNASILGNGSVLIAGGYTQCPSSSLSFCQEPLRSVLNFDQSSNQFQGAPPMTTKRGSCAATGLSGVVFHSGP